MVYPIAHHPVSLYAIDWEEGYQQKNELSSTDTVGQCLNFCWWFLTHASSLHPWFSVAPPVALPKPRAFTNYSKTGTALLSTSFGRHFFNHASKRRTTHTFYVLQIDFLAVGHLFQFCHYSHSTQISRPPHVAWTAASQPLAAAAHPPNGWAPHSAPVGIDSIDSHLCQES